MMVTALLSGCASTRFHDIMSTVAPGTRFKKIIVHSDLADPQTQKIVEDAVVRQFQAIGVSATPSYAVFPPGNSDTWDFKKQTIQANGFDAGLLVQELDSHSSTTTEFFSFDQTAQDVSTAHFKIQTKLVETNSFVVVWQAKSSSREVMDDAGDFSFEGVMTSYASTLVDELQNEGIVAAR